MKLADMFLTESKKEVLNENAALMGILNGLLQTKEGQKLITDLIQLALSGKIPGSIGNQIKQVSSKFSMIGR